LTPGNIFFVVISTPLFSEADPGTQ